MVSIARYAPEPSCKVATPQNLADAMVQRLGDAPTLQWLEPSFGTGVFITSLNVIGVAPDRIRAIDLDRQPMSQDARAAALRGVDFLDWAKITDERFDRIVANPPYVPIRALSRSAQRKALSPIGSCDDVHVSKQANVWLAFLVGCVHLLRPNGSLAIVLPASWDFGTYAARARTCFPQRFREFIVFRSRKPLFPGVEEGSVVLIATGFGQAFKRQLRIEVNDLESLVDHLSQRSLTKPQPDAAAANSNKTGIPLGNMLEIRIGAVTGDSRYFVLSEERRRRYRLPVSACIRIITKARHIQTWAVDQQHWERLRDRGEKVWLFRPSDRCQRCASVQAYLTLREPAGGCSRAAYKVKSRKPWHQTRLPLAADCFISPTANCGPWLALNQTPQLTATNTLYLGRFVEAQTTAERCAVGVALLTSVAREQLKVQERIYAGGLRKFEPSDLSRIYLPPIHISAACVRVYQAAIQELFAGNEASASSLADSLVLHAPKRNARIT